MSWETPAIGAVVFWETPAIGAAVFWETPAIGATVFWETPAIGATVFWGNSGCRSDCDPRGVLAYTASKISGALYYIGVGKGVQRAGRAGTTTECAEAVLHRFCHVRDVVTESRGKPEDGPKTGLELSGYWQVRLCV